MAGYEAPSTTPQWLRERCVDGAAAYGSGTAPSGLNLDDLLATLQHDLKETELTASPEATLCSPRRRHDNCTTTTVPQPPAFAARRSLGRQTRARQGSQSPTARASPNALRGRSRSPTRAGGASRPGALLSYTEPPPLSRAGLFPPRELRYARCKSIRILKSWQAPCHGE